MLKQSAMQSALYSHVILFVINFALLCCIFNVLHVVNCDIHHCDLLHTSKLAEVYQRCRPELHSFNQYCYLILDDPVPYMDIGHVCDQYGSLLVWFDGDSEIQWLQTVLQAFSIDCIHIGKGLLACVFLL